VVPVIFDCIFRRGKQIATECTAFLEKLVVPKNRFFGKETFQKNHTLFFDGFFGFKKKYFFDVLFSRKKEDPSYFYGKDVFPKKCIFWDHQSLFF
jgi:hypothetical protein